ncbi:hypothetical protein LMG19083_02701 [Ralstonia psammae]|uniref:Uncharacterized protein n=1 Tax=Ralstonia psammae TaxID=3058598 RepID=A0ABN9J001_9RALS|nr:hypothetical protein LMG19083_02701 [Ralstonia sp. LMG 19083]
MVRTVGARRSVIKAATYERSRFNGAGEQRRIRIYEPHGQCDAECPRRPHSVQ